MKEHEKKKGKSGNWGWAEYKRGSKVEIKRRGNECLGKGDSVKAIGWFSLGIIFDSSDEVFFSNRSAAWAHCKRWAEALNDGQSAININPAWSKGYSRVGAALFYLKRFDESLESYKKALEIDPSNTLIRNSFDITRKKVRAHDFNEHGEEALAKDKLKDALHLFKQACELDPDESLFWMNSYRANSAAGHFLDAFQCASIAVQLKPSWIKGHLAKGDALYKLERFDEAVESYSYALQLNPNDFGLQRTIESTIQEGVRDRLRKKMKS